jgi:hypothetical protein
MVCHRNVESQKSEWALIPDRLALTPLPPTFVETEMKVVLLTVLVLFLADRLVRVENQRYALMTGLCEIDHAAPRRLFECLEKAQTRTSWFWHLYYGITSDDPAVPLFHR